VRQARLDLLSWNLDNSDYQSAAGIHQRLKLAKSILSQLDAGAPIAPETITVLKARPKGSKKFAPSCLI